MWEQIVHNFTSLQVAGEYAYACHRQSSEVSDSNPFSPGIVSVSAVLCELLTRFCVPDKDRMKCHAVLVCRLLLQ